MSYDLFVATINVLFSSSLIYHQNCYVSKATAVYIYNMIIYYLIVKIQGYYLVICIML